MLDQFFPLLDLQLPMFGDDLCQNNIHFPRHMGRIAADVKVCLFQKQVVDLLAVFAEFVLDVHLFRAFPGESGDYLEG